MDKPLIHEDFLLGSEPARRLYHDYARGLPIFDYHCHLPVREIAENRRFENLSRIWLAGDHYKWRALRALGVAERLVTGEASDREKFDAWAAAVPFTVRNPLYHWTHMELKDPFGIADRLLCPETGPGIWERCNERLATEGFRARALMLHFRVRAVCTTDDPTDDLSQHRALAEAGQRGEFAVKVLPAFRPDKAMAVESPEAFNQWLDRLELAAGEPVRDYRGLIEALQARHRFFHETGCRLSDHGIEEPYAEDYTERELAASFRRLRSGRPLDCAQALRFKSGLLYELAVMDGERGWTQQFHFGALRNNSRRMHEALGPDTGFDSIGDFQIGGPLVRLLDRLDREGRLARTILYGINPRDNEMLASIAGSFQDGSVRGKMQLGSAWWFNDQLDGMRRQLESLSSIGLLSTFVGMLTDSRSFLSYPRHDYFRRLLCNLIGEDVQAGLLPADLPHLGGIVRDVCFNNAARYFAIAGVEPV
jgi:glucuronate isomerase